MLAFLWCSHALMRRACAADAVNGSRVNLTYTMVAVPNTGSARPLYISTDSGATWTGHAPAAYWQSAAVTAGGAIWAATTNEDVYYSPDGTPGSLQRYLSPGARCYGGGISVSADGSVLVCGRAGYMRYSGNRGRTWTSISAPQGLYEYSTVPKDLTGVVQVTRDGSTLVFTALDEDPRCLYFSRDAGRTWQGPIVPPMQKQYGTASMAYSADGAVIVAIFGTAYGGYSVPQISRDGGATWGPTMWAETRMFSSQGLWTGVAVSADGHTIVTSRLAYFEPDSAHVMYRSDDGGLTYVARTIPSGVSAARMRPLKHACAPNTHACRVDLPVVY